MSVDITCHTTEFGTTGQITPNDLQEIANQGYKSVINNRPDGEGGDAQPLSRDIEAAALKAGLAYAYLPVISGQVTKQQVEETAKLLNSLPKPILAFCRSGARSTNLYMFAQQIQS